MGSARKRKVEASAAYIKSATGFVVGKMAGTAFLFAALAIYTGVSIGVHNLISEEQPEPYMDEIFHVPQTQKYCNGIYTEWDPKITTLPGTYVVSSAILSAWNNGLGMLGMASAGFCSTTNLRAVNVGISVLNFCLIYCILGSYNPDMCQLKRVVSAVNIGTLPVLYFFSFFYYTDTIATAFLLLMHYLYLNGKYGYSAMAGAYSVFVRQTNIVWVFYHGINCILEILLRRYGETIFLLILEVKKLFNGKTTKTKRNNKAGKKTNKPVVRPVSAQSPPSLIRVWKECGDDFLDHGIGYILVGILFLFFVVYNGSIVVGDKQAHQATLNTPQVLYFALVFGTFTIPFMASRVRTVGYTIIRNPNNLLFFAALFAVAIYFNTSVHPYLLADNRHYTFYVWKRFYENVPCFRYIWIPFYLMVWTLITSSMGVQKVILYNYVFCACVNLIPQLLLEFRYFIPAYMFARLTFKNPTWFELLAELVIHMAFNVLTVHIFLNIPFQWVDTPGTQRFMW